MTEIIVHLWFVGTFFFLFCFWLIDPLRIFFKFFLGSFLTYYHVILPYIDAFDTYIVTGAWNTKPCKSHSIFILLSRKLQKSISQPNLQLKSTYGLFFQSRCPLGIELLRWKCYINICRLQYIFRLIFRLKRLVETG